MKTAQLQYFGKRPLLPARIIAVAAAFILSTANLMAQCELLQNKDFEEKQLAPSGELKFVDASQVTGWKTTASDNLIEVWSSGHEGVNAFSGKQFVELNANMVSTLYQEFNAAKGMKVVVSFAHRGRQGTDVMKVEIGPIGGPYTSIGTFSDGMSWQLHNTDFDIPSEGRYALRFASISTANGGPTVGNFLDAISISLVKPTFTQSQHDVSVNGLADGSATVSISSGAEPITYQWSPRGGTGATASSLGPGNYNCFITDANGCVVSATFAITEPAKVEPPKQEPPAEVKVPVKEPAEEHISRPPVDQKPTTKCHGPSVKISSTPATAPGAADGTAEADVIAGKKPYTYHWSPAGGVGQRAISLSPGDYTCTVTDGKNCSTTVSVTVAVEEKTEIKTQANGEPLAYIGFSLMPGFSNQLVTFKYVKILGNGQQQVSNISQYEFMCIAKGIVPSEANPKQEDLFAKYGITGTAYWRDNAFNRDGFDSCVVDALWRLRYPSYPFKVADKTFNPGPGWATGQGGPSAGQAAILKEYGTVFFTDPIIGENAFRLLHDMLDAAWRSRYSGS